MSFVYIACKQLWYLTSVLKTFKTFLCTIDNLFSFVVRGLRELTNIPHHKQVNEASIVLDDT